MHRLFAPFALILSLLGGLTPVAAANLTVAEFRRELVGVPLCGTPTSGTFTGKMLCTVHLPDGTVVVAGEGFMARGLWSVFNGQICRRNVGAPLSARRCIDYEKIAPDRYRNSDGVEMCVGPCVAAPVATPPAAPAATSPTQPAEKPVEPKPAAPSEKPAEPADKPAAPAEKPAEPVTPPPSAPPADKPQE